MNKTLNSQQYVIIFGIPLLLIALIVFIVKSPIFALDVNKMAFAITFDLLLTIPFVYFLLIRKTKIPKTTIVPSLILGLVIGSIILPPENQYYLSLFKNWVMPVVELTILTFVAYNVRKTIKRFKQNKTIALDFFTVLKNTCYEILPKQAVIPFATEIGVFYYGFIYWKRRALKENEFSYHKSSGTIALLIVIILLVVVETFVFHLLLVKWSNTAAWVLTILSIYTAIQLFGFIKSMAKRPTSIENNKLNLRYGIMSESTIDLSEIESVEITSKDIEFNEEVRKLSILGELESHNVIIKLNKENTLTGLYGIKRKFKVLAIYLDNKTAFKDQIDKQLTDRKTETNSEVVL